MRISPLKTEWWKRIIFKRIACRRIYTNLFGMQALKIKSVFCSEKLEKLNKK
jgi:hypothetical protein